MCKILLSDDTRKLPAFCARVRVSEHALFKQFSQTISSKPCARLIEGSGENGALLPSANYGQASGISHLPPRPNTLKMSTGTPLASDMKYPTSQALQPHALQVPVDRSRCSSGKQPDPHFCYSAKNISSHLSPDCRPSGPLGTSRLNDKTYKRVWIYKRGC